MDGPGDPQAYLPITGSFKERLRTSVRDPATYVDLRWMLAYCVYGALGCLALPLWPAGLLVDGVWCGLLGRLPVVLPLISRLADLDAAWSAVLLRPSPRSRLAERVAQLTQTRAGAIAAHSAELRRIERDLHDGAQARLVALSMRIGLVKRAYDSDPASVRKLLDEAQDQAEEALAELRHVVRGIHPPILTDRGLAGAVRALAASSGLDVTVWADDLDDGPRAPVAVEAAAYFVVAEALTNAAKHSGSDRAEVRLTRTPKSLLWSCGTRAGAEPRLAGTMRADPGCPACAAGSPHSTDLRRDQSSRWSDRNRNGAAMRVVIAEDNALLREGMVLLLTTAGHEVVAVASAEPEILPALLTHRPDIAVLDVRMPPGFRDEGLRAALAARTRIPGLPVLVLSQYVEESYAAELLGGGASGVGYLIKDRVGRVEEFLDALTGSRRRHRA